MMDLIFYPCLPDEASFSRNRAASNYFSYACLPGKASFFYGVGCLYSLDFRPRASQAVEKVADGSIGGPGQGSKRPKTGLALPERGSEKGTEEFSTGSGLLGNPHPPGRILRR
jgi:hypothetical protein